jgi:hypothetical protein
LIRFERLSAQQLNSDVEVFQPILNRKNVIAELIEDSHMHQANQADLTMLIGLFELVNSAHDIQQRAAQSRRQAWEQSNLRH